MVVGDPERMETVADPVLHDVFLLAVLRREAHMHLHHIVVFVALELGRDKVFAPLANIAFSDVELHILQQLPF